MLFRSLTFLENKIKNFHFWQLKKSCNSGFGVPEDAPFSSIAMGQLSIQPVNPEPEVLPEGHTVTTNLSHPKSIASLSSLESINSISDADLGQLAEIVDQNLGTKIFQN